MATTRETGKRGRQGGLRWGLSLGACLLAGALAGCSGGQSHLAGDPLYGEYGLKERGPSSPPPASAPPSRTQAGVPPIPSAQFSTSPAALAAGPLPGARPLAIDGAGRPTGSVIPASASGATLKPIVQPVPRDTGAGAPRVLPAANTWGPQTTAANEAAILQQLKTRGVLYHKIDTLPDSVRLSVMVPIRNQPDATRVYEATGRDLPSAAQAIIQKLESAR